MEDLILFSTMYRHRKFDDELNSGELVTEAGQSFTTREIYTRFLQTGRVLGEARPVVYDEEELGREPQINDYDVTQSPDYDLSDVSEQSSAISNLSNQRMEINRLSALFKNGKITFDDFVILSSRQNKDLASPLIEHYKKELAKKASSQGTKQSEETKLEA